MALPAIQTNTNAPLARLGQWGAQALGDSELMAIVLGTESLDLAALAMQAAEQAGGLNRTSQADLVAVPGVTARKAAVILAAVELGRRESLRASKRQGWRFSGSRQTFEFFREQLGDQQQERFMVAGVDAKNRLLGSRLVSLGTLTQSLVHPREVFQPILAMHAAGIFIAHNHPSGDPAPSPEDHEVTRRLKGCADLLAISFIDHLIIGRDRYFSYADSNWPK